ncbi:MAG: ABC transporter permease, partial [Spirochaetia bacterium]|nr:ABC transporter permease [Spirochaetia bacterium]
MRQLIRNFLPFASLLALIILLSILVPESFLSLDNLLNVLRRSSVYGIMAVGMTLIIISGGIDLSVGSLMALAGMCGTLGMLSFGETGIGAWLGILLGMVVGMSGGFLNGFLITKIRIQPFIVTLGSMSLFRGIALVMNDGQPYNVSAFKYLGEGAILGIPISILIFAFVALVFFFILRYTSFGRYTYAIGSNRNAAFYAGIPVNRNLIWIYTLSGLLIGLSSMIAVSRTVSA